MNIGHFLLAYVYPAVAKTAEGLSAPGTIKLLCLIVLRLARLLHMHIKAYKYDVTHLFYRKNKKR
jgi:hypothetical protein